MAKQGNVARPSIEIASLLSVILEKKYPQDYIVLYTIRAWGYITRGWVTMDHLERTLIWTSAQVKKSVDRLRNKDLIAWAPVTGHLSITAKGKQEFWKMKGAQAMAEKKFQDVVNENRPNNLPNKKET